MISKTNALTFIKNNKYKIIAMIIIVLIIIIVVCCVLLIKPANKPVVLSQETKDYIKKIPADDIYMNTVNNSLIDMLKKDTQKTSEPFANEDVVLVPYLIGEFYRIYKDLMSKNISKETVKSFMVEYANTHDIKLSTGDINSFGSEVKKLMDNYLKNLDTSLPGFSMYDINFIKSIDNLLFSYANIDYELLVEKINYEFNNTFKNISELCGSIQQSINNIFKYCENKDKNTYNEKLKNYREQELMIETAFIGDTGVVDEQKKVLVDAYFSKINEFKHKYGEYMFFVCKLNGLKTDDILPILKNNEDVQWLIDNYPTLSNQDDKTLLNGIFLKLQRKYGPIFFINILNKIGQKFSIRGDHSSNNKTTSEQKIITLSQETKDYIKNILPDNIYIKAVNNSFIDMLMKDYQQTIEPFTNEDVVLTPYLIGNFYRIYKDLMSKNVPKEIIKAFIIEYANTHNITLLTGDIDSFGSDIKILLDDYLAMSSKNPYEHYDTLIKIIDNLLFSYANIDYELLIEKINYEFNTVFPEIGILCKDIQQSIKDVYKDAESINKEKYDMYVKAMNYQFLIFIGEFEKTSQATNGFIDKYIKNANTFQNKYGNVFTTLCISSGIMTDLLDPAPTKEEDIVWLVNNYQKFIKYSDIAMGNYAKIYGAKYGDIFISHLLEKLSSLETNNG